MTLAECIPSLREKKLIKRTIHTCVGSQILYLRLDGHYFYQSITHITEAVFTTVFTNPANISPEDILANDWEIVE